VPVSERPCSDACGAGVQRCVDNAFQSCEVPPMAFDCANTCGQGSQLCERGVLAECVVPEVVEGCMSVCGDGVRICRDDKWIACNAPRPKPPVLHALIRDFSDQHPDFERAGGGGDDRGIVRDLLGMDDKPVYASSGTTPTTSGRANFDQWYNGPIDAERDLQLQKAPDNPEMFVYQDNAFFPIDGDAVTNEGRNHNFHFTLETSFNFRYLGGEVFRFRGDDDLWVFVNRHLAIDLGGLHQSEMGEVELDRVATDFGLVTGEVYPLHLFFAERHTVQSNFSVETTIADPGTCD
jgi:fibro-slime domain-containing protein